MYTHKATRWVACLVRTENTELKLPSAAAAVVSEFEVPRFSIKDSL